MNIWMRAGLTRYLGRRLLFARESHNSELLGLAPFHPYIFGPAIRPPKRWRRALSTESGAGGPRRSRKGPTRKDYVSSIPLPKYRHNPQAWVSFLEPYIPESLRLRSDCTVRPGASETDQCRAIQHILHKARELSNFDLLSYLGIQLNRWEAAHAVIQRLLDHAKDFNNSSPPRGELPSNLSWDVVGSFDHITSIELKREGFVPVERGARTPLSAYDHYSEEPRMSGQLGEYNGRLGIMEEIWQSLGSTVLDAPALPPEESRIAMSYVYRVLARLHHFDFIPNEVYKYAPPKQGEALVRPPGIHILSSHIMNVLSDAVWQANEAEAASKAAAEGSKVIPPRYKMRVRELGHSIWLDFILWCCVEGGYAKEGAWILRRMKKRSGEKAWSVKSWDSLDLAAESIHPSSVDRDHLWGESVKFPGESSSQSESPFQGLGERTICSEVVTSLMDGLVNTMSGGVGHRGNPPGYVQDLIAVLKSILDENKIPVTRNHILLLIARIIEAEGVVPEIQPQAFENVLKKLAPPVSPDQLGDSFSSLPGTGLEPPPMEAIANNSAVIFGSYRYMLDAYCFAGNAGAALDTFKTILTYVDAAKIEHSRQFAHELKRLVRSQEQRTTETMEEARDRLLNLESDSTDFDQSSVPLIANSSLALLLDLSTSCKAYTFARWLLCSTDADGPVIPLNSYGDDVLAPAIIRFATATNDQDILDAVTERLTVPLSNHVLKSVLNYKIAVNDWDKVAQLLAHLRDEKNSHWGVANVTSLAAAIVVLDKQPRSKSQQLSLSAAKGIMVQLLEGSYDREQIFARPRYTYQEEVMYQLHRLFSSVPGSLSSVCSTVEPKWKPRGRDIIPRIPATAFRNLLSAVVEQNGSAEGRRLWDMWCVYPQSPLSSGASLLYFSNELVHVDRGTAPKHDDEWWRAQRRKAVYPDLRSVRLVAQGAVAEYQKFQSQSEPWDDDNGIAQENTERVLEWSIEVFRNFRLRDFEIDRELEGYLSHWKRKPKSRKHTTSVNTATPDTDSSEQTAPTTN